MAYQLKRKQRINKTLELLGKDGKVETKLVVDIAVDDFRNRYPLVIGKVKEAQTMLDEKGDDDASAIAASQIAMKAVFVLVFGESQTRQFLDYYQNRYSEAFLDVIPFITEEIIPAVQKAVKEEQARISSIMK